MRTKKQRTQQQQKRKRTGIQRVIDALSRDSSGKRRLDVAQTADMLEDIRRLLYNKYGIDFYDLLDEDSRTMFIIDDRGGAWWGVKKYDRFPSRRRRRSKR